MKLIKNQTTHEHIIVGFQERVVIEHFVLEIAKAGCAGDLESLNHLQEDLRDEIQIMLNRAHKL